MNETTLKLVMQSLQQRVKTLKAENAELRACIEELKQQDQSDIHKQLSAVATVIETLGTASPEEEEEAAASEYFAKKKAGRPKKVDSGNISITD
jgi:prefoldin subunit 5